MKTVTWKRVFSRRTLLKAGIGTTLLALVPLGAEVRISDAKKPFTNNWSQIPIEPRSSTLLGITFRPQQVQAFGLEMRPTLNKLLEYPLQIVRLGAYWNKMEPENGRFDTTELDWQIDTIEKTGAKIILCVGALKTFGYPEYFIPHHYMPKPFPDATLITPIKHKELLLGANNFISRIVDRYKNRQSIIAWQLENEPADPLPSAHYWRISADFLKEELNALRVCDQTKPVMINGFLATSLFIRIGAAWLTRDQGNSLDLAKGLSDIIGVDYYPRIAISPVASETMYLDTSKVFWGQGDRNNLANWSRSHNQKFMVAEGQSEPWELTVIPPSPQHYALYSCTPQNLIENYNFWASCAECRPMYSYLFWGAEYWVLRANNGNRQYLDAFAKILSNA